MSRITMCDAPPRRSSGRKPRLSDEEFKDLAETIQKGNWGTDGESVPTKTAAYQRAQTAVKELERRFDLKNLTTGVVPHDDNTDRADDKGWYWRVGPLPEGEKPRAKKATKAGDKKTTDGTAKS